MEKLDPALLAELENILTPTQILQLKAREFRSIKSAQDFADIQTSTQFDDLPIQLYTIALDTGYDQYNPFEISFPFKSLWVYNATDANVSGKLHLNSRKIPHIINGLPIAKNFAVSFPTTIGVAYITAPAQAGKSFNLVVVKDGTISPGLTISQNAGGLSINDGSAISQSTLSVGTSAVQILATNTNRKVAFLTNQGSETIFLGGATVTVAGGTLPGIPLEPGSTREWRITSALYGINATGNQTLSVVEGT